MNSTMETQERERDREHPNLLERLLRTRTILIFGEINQKLAQDVSEKLLFLAQESNEDIKIIINSQGGHVESGDTVFDMIRFVEPQVKIIGTGWVASAGALIFVAPPREQRYCLPNTRFLLHQPLGSIGGSAKDLAIEAEEIIKMRKRLNEILARQTGQPIERIDKDTDRNFWLTAEEALNYGLVGHVVESMSEV